MEDKVIEILKEYVDKKYVIKSTSALKTDLGLSSLDVVNIVVAFEDEYDIEIPDKVIPSLEYVQDIVDYLNKNV